MPDKRQHRGANPEDVTAFAESALPVLTEAVSDLSWLLTRGYGERSTKKLVGDRFALTERQRIAMRRCACSDTDLQSRISRLVSSTSVGGVPVRIDGYNVLTTVEAALGGGVVLVGRDGCYRDMASMHGNFKRVAETPVAIRLIGQTLARLGTGPAHWLLDSPVSNSGRLKQLIAECAEEAGWAWTVELVPDPDRVLIEAGPAVASADSGVLDRCGSWINLAREVVVESVPDAWIVDLGHSIPSVA